MQLPLRIWVLQKHRGRSEGRKWSVSQRGRSCQNSPNSHFVCNFHTEILHFTAYKFYLHFKKLIYKDI